MSARVRRWRSVITGAICAGLAAMSAACGSPDPDEGTNGLAGQPPATIEERALDAAQEAVTVRLSGSVVADGRSFRLDMRLGPDGGVGEVSTEGMTFELLRVGEQLFIKADEAFWEYRQGEGEETDPEIDPAERLEGKYVKVAPEDPAYQQLSGFTDKNALLAGLLVMEGERETGERGEIGGRKTIQVLADGGAGGVLEVSLTGEPYPLRLARGGDAGEVQMGDWGEEFTLRAPKEEQIVDYGDKVLPDTGGEAG
ncbi:hypothetical protein [Streptomyces aidingensis]|uniref:Lipoprotein n=1 Tax=Streptomyces aidingensis TaxID=910347 RepID=A0A1I1EVI6_9ACTN|nr:hypothetical protein [Streptomyces aidingensis]SFB90987.1 hypothetical protein SAMN05421773_101480 [Streptomyces aidingensis]